VLFLSSGMKFFSLFVLAGTTALALSSCQKEADTPPLSLSGKLTLQLDNVVGQASSSSTIYTPLVLDAVTYKNANGDDFTVTTFKYYLSNLTLYKADGSIYAVPNSYFLIDQAKDDSRKFTLTEVPTGDYTSLSFVVGVDSVRTKAGNFSGVLNADNGMFWDMNGPEFINFKLEGRSPQSPTTALVFHVAGYKGQANNTIRTVRTPFPTALLVRPEGSSQIRLRADVAKLFTGPNPTTAAPAPFLNPVSFATVYNRMSGPSVAKLADNIAAGMFSVTEVQAN
jgi:hypothetical protein